MAGRGTSIVAWGMLAAGCGGSVVIVEETRIIIVSVESDAGAEDAPDDVGTPPVADAGSDAPLAVDAAGEAALPDAIAPLASGQNNPLQIVANDSDVYWTSAGTQSRQGADGAVLRLPVGGGTPSTLWVGPAFAVAIDQVNVYFTGGGNVIAMPLLGGPTSTLASGQAGGPNAVASDGTSVYWVNNTGNVNNPSSVKKVPVGGGAVVTLAADRPNPNSIAVDARNVYWGEGELLAPDGGAPRVVALPVGGGVPVTLATGSPEPPGAVRGPPPAVAVYGPSVFAAFRVDPLLGIVRVAAGGGPLFSIAQDDTPFLAVDESNVYFTRSETSSISRVSIDGGSPVVIASGQSGPGAIAVNDASVFWTVANSGNLYGMIMKTAK